MTNLEANKDEIKKLIKKGERFGCAICKAKNKHCTQCCGDDGDDILCNVVDWLLEEYKEPIKLKKWEYDLIDIYCNVHNWKNAKLKNTTLFEMKDKGYFKGVIDTSMTIEEILNNCEVVDD